MKATPEDTEEHREESLSFCVSDVLFPKIKNRQSEFASAGSQRADQAGKAVYAML
jgi:hypothetical protein